MSSGGVRINSGRKKVGVIVNTRIEEQLIEQIEQYISGLSRAEKIRKCLLLGLEHKKSKIKNDTSETNTNAVNKFFKVYIKLLSLLKDTEINNVKTLNKYLLGFFTTIIPAPESLNVPVETHNAIVAELEKFTWSLNEQDGYNSITPSTIGSVIEKVVNQKETGSYYTPKDTTGYIAKYSIVFSLLCKCNSPALAYHFYEQYDEQSNVGVLNDSSNPVEKLANAINQLSESEKKDVFNSILEFTIIDPTCGTGAFIIAAADVMIELYKSTNMYWHVSLSDYVVNLFRNCLFGVDITESAIALIHLRCKLYLYNLGISRDIAETISFQFYCGDSLIKPNEKKSARSFNWKSTFPSVFKSGGFDCIIGNPPYVESSKINVNINDYGEYKTKKCGNLYAYILENSLNILKDNAYMGMIVPISITSTQRMEPLRNVLFDNCENVYIANFSDRPACLFAGVHQKLSIVFVKKTKPQNGCKVYTSSYNHWSKKERSNLFDSVKYYRTTKNFINSFGMAKLGDEIKLSILKKIKECPHSFDSILSNNNKNDSIYLNQRMTFWVKCFSKAEISKEYKRYFIDETVSSKAVSALINSSLFFLLWETYSDCWHITQSDLWNLRICDNFFKDSYQTQLIKLTTALEQKLYETREYIYSKQTDYIYIHRKCYDEISAINDLIAEVYGFSEEEKEYIQNYNEKYRLSVSNNTEEE